MRRRRSRWDWRRGLGLLLAGLALSAAAPARAADAPAAPGPVWRYGMLASYPPFQIWPAGGWPGGADLDLLQAAAQAAGGRIEPVRYERLDELLADLRRGRIDLASAMARTPEREAGLSFSLPYARIEQVLVLRSRDADVPLVADLAGRRVAVAAGHASEAAFLAHEVRNSLHSVVAGAELLRGEPGVAPAVAEPLGQSARSTLALLNGLLDRERLAAGGLTLDAGPGRLSALLRGVLQEMEPAAHLAGAGLQLQPLAESDPMLQLDALRVQQVLRNLLSNAIKYASPGPVSVAAQVQPGAVPGGACGVEITRCATRGRG